MNQAGDYRAKAKSTVHLKWVSVSLWEPLCCVWRKLLLQTRQGSCSWAKEESLWFECSHTSLENLDREREWVRHFPSSTSTPEVPLSKVLNCQLLQYFSGQNVYNCKAVFCLKCIHLHTLSFLWEIHCCFKYFVRYVSFNTFCFTQILSAELANTAGSEMTVMGRSLVPQWLCQCHYEWKWKLLNTRWLTRQSLCPKALPTMDTKHSLCLVWLWFFLCVAKSECTVLPTVTLSSMQGDSHSICTAKVLLLETISGWMACLNLWRRSYLSWSSVRWFCDTVKFSLGQQSWRPQWGPE